MKVCLYFPSLVACTLLSFSATSDARGDEIVYREVFPNSVSTNSTATVGWLAHGGNTGAQVGGIGLGNTVHLATGGTSPQPAPINSGPVLGPTSGRTFHGGTAGEPQLTWTNEYTVDGSQYLLTEVRWWEQHTGSPALSLAVQVNGGNWYATDQTATATGAPASGGFDERSIDLTTATYQQLDFTPGSTLALVGPTGLSLPAYADITAFGFFEDAFASSLRFDDFTLFAVDAPPPPLTPEPTTFVLMGITLLAGAGYHWRKSK